MRGFLTPKGRKIESYTSVAIVGSTQELSPQTSNSVRLGNRTCRTGVTTFNSTILMIQIRKGLFPLGVFWQIFLPNP